MEQLSFERQVWLYRLALPLMYFLYLWVYIKKAFSRNLKYYCWLYDKHSLSVQRVRFEASKWGALDELYNYKRQNGFYGWIADFWMHIRNAQAVRNRKTVVVNLIREMLTNRQANEEIRILSLASGSTQAVLEAVRAFEGVKVLAVDQDLDALDSARKLADEYGVDLDCMVGDVLSPSTYVKDFDPHIIEVVGLMDYLSDKLVVGVLRRIRKVARVGTILLTAHIHPNSEEKFLKEVVDWSMIYRSADNMRQLIAEAGWSDIELHSEPHRIHTVYRACAPAHALVVSGHNISNVVL